MAPDNDIASGGEPCSLQMFAGFYSPCLGRVYGGKAAPPTSAK